MGLKGSPRHSYPIVVHKNRLAVAKARCAKASFFGNALVQHLLPMKNILDNMEHILHFAPHARLLLFELLFIFPSQAVAIVVLESAALPVELIGMLRLVIYICFQLAVACITIDNRVCWLNQLRCDCHFGCVGRCRYNVSHKPIIRIHTDVCTHTEVVIPDVTTVPVITVQAASPVAEPLYSEQKAWYTQAEKIHFPLDELQYGCHPRNTTSMG